jgi:small subunit ribosomal protein S21
MGEQSGRFHVVGWLAVSARPNTSKKGGENSVTKVVIEDGESFDSLLRRFNKKVQRDRVMSEVRRRRFFEKPSVIRKRKKAAKLRKSRRQSFKERRGNT